jgi:hypothetical protein
VKHFIRFVNNLDAIADLGTNEDFFHGCDYATLSDGVAALARKWCMENLAAIRLKSEGAKDDELELYVIRLGEKSAAKQLKSLVTTLSRVIFQIVREKSLDINEKDMMTSKANEAFDTLEEVARLRTLLLKAAGRRRLGEAAALLLYV